MCILNFIQTQKVLQRQAVYPKLHISYQDLIMERAATLAQINLLHYASCMLNSQFI